MAEERWRPTEKQIEDYHLFSTMLNSLAKEIRELSKKKQDGTLNLTKVKMLNRVLEPLKNDILGHLPSTIFLDLLDEDTLPNNSDAVLIISQFEAAIKDFREEYHHNYRDANYNLRTYWETVENPEPSEESDDDEDED